MASTDYFDSTNDRAKLQSALGGNLSAFRLRRVSVSYASDANKTLLNTEYDAPIIDIAAGVVTATRNLVFPLTDGAIWFVRNRTAQSIQCIGASGTGTTIATLKAAWVYCDGTNISRMSADVTV
jgi:hypothetical protein